MIYTIAEIQNAILPVAVKHRLRAVYLFGSYARGTATEANGIDLETEDKTRLAMLPFGIDPFGNFFCIKDNKVVFFDHESRTVFAVANMFTEFLEELHD